MSTAKTLPDRPNLEHLKKLAKRLLDAQRTGDPDAVQRFAEFHPRRVADAQLADAQLVIAREYGFRSWPALVHHLSLDEQSQRLHDIERMLKSLPDARTITRPLREVLEHEVDALREAHRARHPAVVELIRTGRWQSGATTADSAEAILDGELTLDEARHAIARWHDFKTWPDVIARGDEPVDPAFEAAADAIVEGDSDALRALIAEQPALVHARSAYAHRAMLLHYVAANGIENSRQWQSPPNAVEVATILLRAGADPNAECELYGGGSTTMGLLVSSAHPARAGVQAALVDTLVDFGAAVAGPGWGGPLMTALEFGYLPAAEALARRGAPVDSVIVAAGLGRLELVRAFFDETGAVKHDIPLSTMYGMEPHDPQAQADQALVMACRHDRLAVVDFLLHHVDKAAVDGEGMTGLHLAAWHGHMALLELLLAHDAPLEAKNRYGGTVLDMTIWAARNAPRRGVDYPAVVARLLAAGADRSVVELPTGIAAIDELLS